MDQCNAELILYTPETTHKKVVDIYNNNAAMKHPN